MNHSDKIVNWAVELQSLAQAGLAYGRDKYDIERFERILEIKSPAEKVIKEVKEEAGLDVVVDKLIAVQDRSKHNQPAYIFGVTKIFFLCRSLGGEFKTNIETIGTNYFAEDELPTIFAEEKCTAEQIRLCFKAHRSQVWEAQFD